MRLDGFVLLGDALGVHRRLPWGVEDLTVEQLGTQLSIATLVVAVLPGRLGFDE